MFDVAFQAYINIPQVQRMNVKISESTKLKPFTYFGISNEPDKINQWKLDAKFDQEFDWPYGSAYISYPLMKQSITGFGSNDSFQLGAGNFDEPNLTKLSVNVPKDFKPVKAWGCSKYHCVLGQNGEVIQSG